MLLGGISQSYGHQHIQIGAYCHQQSYLECKVTQEV